VAKLVLKAKKNIKRKPKKMAKQKIQKYCLFAGVFNSKLCILLIFRSLGLLVYLLLLMLRIEMSEMYPNCSNDINYFSVAYLLTSFKR